MKLFKRVITVAVIFLICLAAASAQSLTVASGAGYRALVDELGALFFDETGIKIDKIYGNMGQVTNQAKISGIIDFVIGDSSFFASAGLPLEKEYQIGNGKLVLAFSSGKGPASLEKLVSGEADRIAHPDPSRAIYGKAASEYLENRGIDKELKDKLIIVGTVPQVSAYLISGEIDMGFINMTDALAISDKIDGWIRVPQEYYSPISIVAGRMAETGSDYEADMFGKFLLSEKAKETSVKHGF